MVNEGLLKQAIFLLEELDLTNAESVQINNTKYDDGSTLIEVGVSYPAAVEVVDEISTKDGVVKKEVTATKVTITSLAVNGIGMFYDNDLQCIISNGNELKIKGPMTGRFYSEVKTSLIVGKRHEYTGTLSDGGVTSGHLYFTKLEMVPGENDERSEVEITVDIFK